MLARKHMNLSIVGNAGHQAYEFYFCAEVVARKRMSFLVSLELLARKRMIFNMLWNASQQAY